MKLKIIVLLSVFFISACKREENNSKKGDVFLQTSLLSVTEERDFYQILYKDNPIRILKSELPLKKAVILNASLVGYFTEIGAEQNIIGVSSPEYIYSQKVRTLINNGTIINVGNEQKYDVEKIISLQPDVVFANYIANFANTYKILQNQGIRVIFLDEFYEQQPLQKVSYIKLFGLLMGKSMEASEKFALVEKNYQVLRSKIKNRSNAPKVIANEMYGNLWYLPGGGSIIANFIRDAGGKYILPEDKNAMAVTKTFEEMLEQSRGVTIWLNAGNHTSRSSLLQNNPYYTKLDAFQQGKIYSITERTREKSNDYFESGVVRADIVLSDYIKILHPEILPNYNLTYLKEIQ